ncbi:PREDICTED: cyclin-dependent kinase-like 2 isoform X1 [Priapulus caudatus]|uniref:Cyclin-dependent kinase-like 2 isoform X1 n=1 Tax=Priapulus caudatus TaxID=37621 RepID=A0ABM1EH13_PRICU|nr:PREDICTED: cyclin-dependent kinase-like 2 isoform X1 [Priapulus caudatus]XP_014671484.1 PREDICTED: cyclin-dependent kinase-like 2 isoform X1 [Priapulus caudatus]XP_014671485.1 PREDICTED: cyclin-dependent kinase-like 2 isoform X1 [Priapulus caudatus]XP_014671486.1 PREDICTED: cyclin-dependent kinase-like 2 isoform X1 [Priapulus caudatus]
MHLDWNLMSDKYECLSLMGDGSYGEVCKARGRDSGAIVAIKRYLEGPEGKAAVKKIAMREIRMLRQLRHENLVNLLEVVNKTGKMFLVFEFVDYTILDELNHYEAPIPHECARKYVFQVVRGIEFCHAHGIVHRDVKPENVLLSTGGVVKVCDLGFARGVPSATTRDQEMTAYVATRWYRAPELLVGDTTYRKEVDVWAIGCLHAEMVLNEPVFAGESDVAQVFLQIRALGSLPDKL